MGAFFASGETVRIAMVHSFYSSALPSGENIAVLNQRDALVRAGHQVLLVARSTDDLEGQTLYKAKSAVTVATGRGHSPSEELKAFKPEIVHVHNLFPNWGTTWLKEWPGPVVSSMHNFRSICAAGTLFRDGHVCELCPRKGAISAVKHSCYRGSALATIPVALSTHRQASKNPVIAHSDTVIFLSQRSADTFSRFGLGDVRARVLPNFVRDEFSKGTKSHQNWVYLGRLSEEKGIRNLVRHWPAGQKLDVFGTGPLSGLVRDSRNPGVVFHGEASRAEVELLLAEAKGLIFSSECAENSPLVYLEAMAAATPIVALAGNSVADDVSKRGHGAVFESWADFPAALAVVENNVESLSRSSRKVFESTYTEDAWVASLLWIYKETIGNFSGVQP
jgi:glycosyltransferase involved in cell wall biosynthesis